MYIQLPTGKTLAISAYEYYFMIKESEVDQFYQACIADDLGTEITNPFSNRAQNGKIEIDEDELEIEDLIEEN